MDLDLLPNAVL